MSTKLNILLTAILFALMTACGGGSMDEKTLTGTKWMLDVDKMEKEAERIVGKIKDEKAKAQAEAGLKQITAFKSMIEAVALEFKEDGTFALDGLDGSPLAGMAQGLKDVKWSLDGGKLYIEAEGQKMGFKVSGSSSAMSFKITKADLEAAAKEAGEEMPADFEKEADNVLPITVSFKAKK